MSEPAPQRPFDCQANLITVELRLRRVAPVCIMANRERGALGLATLHHIPRLKVALPMLAALAVAQVRIAASGVDMRAIDIAGVVAVWPTSL